MQATSAIRLLCDYYENYPKLGNLLEAHPLVQSAIACFLFFMPVSFFESIRRDNYSIVDRLCKSFLSVDN